MKTSRALTMLVGGALFLIAAVSWSAPTGAAAARADGSLTLEEMLRYAIEDERIAHAEYEVILATLGDVRPFTNIIRAEVTHIGWLQDLYRDLGLAVPADTTPKLVSPATLAEALEAGRQAEIDNIAMYDRFLKENLPAGARTIFEQLRAASQNHLRAFTQSNGGRG